MVNKYLDIFVFSPEKGKFAVIFRDITERKKAEETLKLELEELRQSNEELEQFACVHLTIFRNP